MWKTSLPLFIAVILLAACNSLYVPATPPVPVFEKAKELKISGSVGGKGWNTNVDYSPINHLYFGASYHGIASGNNTCVSLGGHAGYYLNYSSSYSHTSFLVGYTYGNASYADQFSGGGGYLRSGQNLYRQIYAQAFHAFTTAKENHWILGLRFDIYHARYPRLWPNLYRDQLPTNTTFPMGFVCYQYTFNKLPALMTDLYFGYQVSTTTQGKYVGYAFYSSLIFRVGVSYKFDLGQKKSKE